MRKKFVFHVCLSSFLVISIDHYFLSYILVAVISIIVSWSRLGSRVRFSWTIRGAWCIILPQRGAHLLRGSLKVDRCSARISRLTLLAGLSSCNVIFNIKNKQKLNNRIVTHFRFIFIHFFYFFFNFQIKAKYIKFVIATSRLYSLFKSVLCVYRQFIICHRIKVVGVDSVVVGEGGGGGGK